MMLFWKGGLRELVYVLFLYPLPPSACAQRACDRIELGSTKFKNKDAVDHSAQYTERRKGE
jgi:hypothetical protein